MASDTSSDMRKKLIIYHALITLCSLLLLLIPSLFLMGQINEKNTKKELKNYLNLSVDVIGERMKDGQDIKDYTTLNLIHSSNTELRITLIDATTGEVKYDSDRNEIEENHLERPEIVHLGNFYTRYSTTLKKDMLYLARACGQKLYVRVAIPVSAINSQINSAIAISIGIFILVLAITIFVDYYAINQSLKPLKSQVNRLSQIVSEEELPREIEIESLSYQVDKTKSLIEDKIQSLTKEQEKLSFIIDSMKQGLLILNGNLDVILINSYLRELFHYQEQKTASLFNVTIRPEFAELFHEAMDNGESQKEVEVSHHTFLVLSSRFEADWLEGSKKGVILTFSDITLEKNLEKAKRDFFANASHELKSPLTSIMGYSEMIRNGFVTEKEEIDADLERILSEARRMNEIVIEMLELSRLEAKEDKKERESLSLREIVDGEIIRFQSEMEKKDIKTCMEGEDFLVSMSREDASMLIKNLLENAIRYNKEGGSISFIFDKEKKSLAIRDTGIGIPEEDKNRIFERFYRVDKARSRKLGGTGLGLSIVKHICLNESIDIHVDSVLGSGSTFTLTFKD